MSLRINTNVAALVGQRNIERTDRQLSHSLERLSSGFRINRAADDPAGLSIAERQRAHIAGLNQAIENVERATSMVQTAEGALDEVNSILVHIRELVIDSANTGVNDASALAANQAEIDNALATLDRIATQTAFGSKTLLDGSAANSVTLADGTNTTIYGTFSNSTLDTGTYSIQLSSVTDAHWTAQNSTTSANMGISGNLAAASQDVSGLTAGAHTVKVTQASTSATLTGAVTLTDYSTAGSEKFKLRVKDASGAYVTAAADLVLSTDCSGSIDDLVTAINTAIDGDANIGSGTVFNVKAEAVGATLSFRTAAHGSGAYAEIVAASGGTQAAGNSFSGFANTDSTDGGGTATGVQGTDAVMELDGSANTVTFIEGSNSGGVSATTITLSDGDDGQAKFASRVDQVTDALRGLNLGNVVLDVTAATGTATIYNSTGGSGGAGSAGTSATFTADIGVSVGAYGSAGSMRLTVGSQILLEGVAAASSYEDLTVVDNALVFQVGSGRGQTVELSLIDVGADTLAQAITNTSNFTDLSQISVLTQQQSADSLLLVDQAIGEVTDVRANMGSFQANTLESQHSNLRIAAENMIAARSTIVDVDFAAEVSEFTKQQILMQAGISVLSSAGQMPQLVLSLLR